MITVCMIYRVTVKLTTVKPPPRIRDKSVLGSSGGSYVSLHHVMGLLPKENHYPEVRVVIPLLFFIV